MNEYMWRNTLSRGRRSPTSAPTRRPPRPDALRRSGQPLLATRACPLEQAHRDVQPMRPPRSRGMGCAGPPGHASAVAAVLGAGRDVGLGGPPGRNGTLSLTHKLPQGRCRREVERPRMATLGHGAAGRPPAPWRAALRLRSRRGLPPRPARSASRARTHLAPKPLTRGRRRRRASGRPRTRASGRQRTLERSRCVCDASGPAHAPPSASRL